MNNAWYEYEGVKLACSIDFIAATEKEREAVNNGCGPEGLDLIPDVMWGLNVSICCKIHDWDYVYENDREKADLRFLSNLIRWINAKSVWLLRGPRRYRALTYYNAVADFGQSSFNKGESV